MPDSTEKVFLSRPRDKTLAAYKEWILELTKRFTGSDNDDMTEAQWEAEWKAFWEA